jgi:hypothetical protein
MRIKAFNERSEHECQEAQRMSVIPIDVEPEEIFIRADHRLAFEVIAAFRSPNTNPVNTIRVLDRWDDENRLLAEFSSPVPLPFGMSSTLLTVEYVTFYEPSRIDFELAEPTGILCLLQERFSLEAVEGGTRFRYGSRFGIAGSVFGWALGQLVFKPMFKRHMRTHVAELKETIEARSSHSRRYPMQDE